MRPAGAFRGSIPNIAPSDPIPSGQFLAAANPQRAHLERVNDDIRDHARAEYLAYRSLVERAVDVFGDEIKASLWLSRPSADLEGKSPLQEAERVHYASAEMDRLFEPIFVRIEEEIYW